MTVFVYPQDLSTKMDLTLQGRNGNIFLNTRSGQLHNMGLTITCKKVEDEEELTKKKEGEETG